MNGNSNYKAIGKGLYKVAFSLCILLLCIITIVITENYNNSTEGDANYASNIQLSHEKIPSENITASEYVDNHAETVEYPDTEETIPSQPQDVSFDFITPVVGDILKSFSSNIPLYSKTMDDWRIHNGIDISSPYGTPVISIENGKVVKTGYDISYGYYIEIIYGDLLARYTSLESGIKHKEGDIADKGEIIGYLSDSCISEICDEAHLHFEMLKDGVYVNPEDYIY